ncbi:MAG: hypothetical protein ABSG53_27130 [Thermoguttaceae bacterium]
MNRRVLILDEGARNRDVRLSERARQRAFAMAVSATDDERGSVFIPSRLASSVARARQGGIQLLFQQ